MNHDAITRKGFIRKTSLGAAGAALSFGAAKRLSASLGKAADNPALLGGVPVREKSFPNWPEYDDQDVEIYLEAYHGRNWSQFYYRDSESMVQFEQNFAQLMGAKYCAATNAGTTALTSALQALGVGPGDEVILPTNTFVASAQAVFNNYALPVFVDSDPETVLMDADRVEERINDKTRAIMPVHIGGAAVDMDKIMALARKHDLAVLEDACQAHMGEWRGKKLGAVGTLGCFSFQEYKCLTSGEGGATIGNDEALMDHCLAYRNNGRDPRNKGRAFPGSNHRMTAFQVAVVTGQMRHIEEQSSRREQNAAHLEELLKDVKGIRPCKAYDGQTRRAYYGYYLLYDKAQFGGLPRGTFIKAMRAEGIPIGNDIDTLDRDDFVKAYLESGHFKRLFSKRRIARFWKENHYPANDILARETALRFGQNVFLGDRNDVEDIVAAIVKVQANAARLS